MSKIGKNPVTVPKDVKVAVVADNVCVEGPKGKLDLSIPQGISVDYKDNRLQVNRASDGMQHRANHGTIRAHLINMVTGVVQGHKRELEIQGIGFRAQVQGKKIMFNLGFSHPVEFDIPTDVKVNVASQTSITVEGAHIQRVGQVAAQIKALKPVEPYKGKGIRYVGENVRRKQGKSVAK